MGFAKRMLEEALSKGYTAPFDTYVCKECITDVHLKEVIEENIVQEGCSYCECDVAAPIEILLREISEAAFLEYDDPANELPYESREGGYQGEIFDSYELLEQIDTWTEDEQLESDVIEAFEDRIWCKKDYFGLNQVDQFRYGWSTFKNLVMHKNRYLFFEENEMDYQDGIPPSKMLEEVGEILKHCSKIVQKGSSFIRVCLVQHEELPCSAERLSAPPAAKAMSSRMSAAGVPLFYAAEDEITAILETYEPDPDFDRVIVVGEWAIKRDFNLLDLTNLPKIPGDFDKKNRNQIHRIKFVHEFAEDLTKPVDRNSNSVDYVPTQIVTEYVRHRLLSETGVKFDGIKYNSSKEGGKVAVVVFAEQQECLPIKEGEIRLQEQLLELTETRCLVKNRDICLLSKS